MEPSSPLGNAHLTASFDASVELDGPAQDGSNSAALVPFCDCPPDPELPKTLILKHLSLSQVLSFPVEVARQMTLIDHNFLCKIPAVELLQKVGMIPKPANKGGGSSQASTQSLRSLSLSTLEQPETAIERLAFWFNQIGNWVVYSVLQFEDLEDRVEAIQNFITIAQKCLEYHNFSTLMSVVVAGLGSAPVRRLTRTWDCVSKSHLEMFRQMDAMLESRNNYKQYRDRLGATHLPAVPYMGVFLKDLTFISDGNPDYLRGGLVNIHKRRQVYTKLEEIRRFQEHQYNFHPVPEIQSFLLNYRLTPEDDLHSRSHDLEPRVPRSLSQSSVRTRSVASISTTTQNFPFFKALSKTTSSSSSNLFRTS